MLVRTMMMGLGATMLAALPAGAADYRVSLVEAGIVDYYCATTVRIENLSDAPLVGINTFVDLVAEGGDLINTSRGVLTGPIEPGGSVEARMLAPNEPCDLIDSYVLVVGTCQLGDGFLNRHTCAEAFDAVEPITGARGR